MIERRVRIIQDRYASDPREWDNVGKMLCWHNRYVLGDKHSYGCDNIEFQLACRVDDELEEFVDRLEGEVSDRLYDRAQRNGCEGWNECNGYAEKYVRKRIKSRIEEVFDRHYISLPLYLHDHSGISMSTGAFSCPWDSGMVGIIVCDECTIQEEFGGDRERAYKALEREVDVYDQYLQGDVWGYIAEKKGGDKEGEWEEVDSCWGFYGNDFKTNGMINYIDKDFYEELATAIIEWD